MNGRSYSATDNWCLGNLYVFCVLWIRNNDVFSGLSYSCMLPYYFKSGSKYLVAGLLWDVT